MPEEPKNTTDDLIAILKQNIENDKNIAMSAIIGRIPLLCKSVLDIHENIKEIKEVIKESNADHERRLRDSEDNILQFKNAQEKTYEFLVSQHKINEARNSFPGHVKQYWVNYIVVALTMAIFGTFMPLIWMWLKHTFGG